MSESGESMDPRIVALVEEGVLWEQCRACQCDKKFHQDSMCTVCWGRCVYAPAFIPRTSRRVVYPTNPDGTPFHPGRADG